MYRLLKRYLGFVFALIFFGPPAGAYVLQGPHILELMIRNTGSARNLLISQRLVLHGRPPAEASAEIRETVRYEFPGGFRSDTLSGEVQRIYVFKDGAALEVVDGKISATPGAGFDRYMDPFIYRSRILLSGWLTTVGVDVSISSLGRFEGNVAYIVGDAYPDDTRSQLWFEKETFRPIRYMLKTMQGHSGRGTLEFRYKNWRQFDTIAYPMKIECLQDALLIREIHVETVRVNPDFPQHLFDMDALRAQYPQGGGGSGAAEALEEVKRTIEDFKRRYE